MYCDLYHHHHVLGVHNVQSLFYRFKFGHPLIFFNSQTFYRENRFLPFIYSRDNIFMTYSEHHLLLCIELKELPQRRGFNYMHITHKTQFFVFVSMYVCMYDANKVHEKKRVLSIPMCLLYMDFLLASYYVEIYF